MIEFIQDYTTKAIPPEVFTDGQQVTDRSAESELYFVRLGVAGFVHEGNLVDQDYQPLVRAQTALVVEGGDRRSVAIGLEAPQRASSGPVTDLFGTNDAGLSQVQIDQLTSDLAASMQQLDEHRTTTTAQIDELTADLTAAQAAREAALADAASARTELDGVTKDGINALAAAADHAAAIEAQLGAANAENGRLQAALDAATKSADETATDSATASAGDTATTTTKRGK